MAQELQAILSQMSDKFDESFADQQSSNKPTTECSPSINLQTKNQLQTLPQTPLKSQGIDQGTSKSSQQRILQPQEDEVQNQKLLQNETNETNNPTKCEVQVVSSQERANYQPQLQPFESSEQQKMQLAQQPLDLEGQEDDELISYLSLTQKFEVALSRLKKTHCSSLSQTQFAARQQDFLRKKTTDLNLMRVEKQKQFARLCPAKPLINSRSQQLLINHKPIYARYQEIVEEKKKKIETQVAEKLARKAEEEQQQLNYIKEHQEEIRKKLGNQVRSQQEYYNEMKSWVEVRNKKVQDYAQKKNEQSKHETTFKPQINLKSELLMKKNATRVPIYDKAPNPKKGTVDSNCTFKPNLNKTSKK